MDKWLRAARAIEIFRHNVWPAGADAALRDDVAFLRRKYDEIKWDMSPYDAALMAQAALLLRVARERAHATCRMCGEAIEYVGPYWDHVGEEKPRHPATPVEEGK
jgi:hypothetical protein